MTRQDDQLQSGPLTIARESAPTATASARAPSRSGKAAAGSRASRRRRRAGTSAGRPTKRLTKNTERQPCQSTSSPPSDGPAAAATAPVAPQSAVAVARRSSGNSGSSKPRDAGTSIAAPRAWKPRAAISMSAEPAAPQTTDAARQGSVPREKKRRRPNLSASRPAGTSAAAKTMLYAFSTQDRCPTDSSGKDFCRSGNAMLTIVTSRKLMNTPTAVTSRTCHLRAMRASPGAACVTRATIPEVACIMQVNRAILSAMLRRDYEGQVCSIARTLELVGDRWTLLILRDVALGVHRFDQLLDSLGVASNILTDRLNRLVTAGVLDRVPYSERPERFEYRLTR